MAPSLDSFAVNSAEAGHAQPTALRSPRREGSHRCPLVLLAMLAGCGPDVRVPAEGGSASGGDTTVGGQTETRGSSESTGVGTSDVPCPEGEYCFERIDLREIGWPSEVAAGDVDGDQGIEVCGLSRPSTSSGSLPPEGWALDWVDGLPRVLQLSAPEVAQVGGPMFVAPSPLDGVVQCYAGGGAYVIEDGSLVIREHPRPPVEGFPPMTVGYAGPVDIDGDGRHEMVGYESSSNIYGYTGHLVRYEADQRIVIGLPLPVERSWVARPPQARAIAAADFDGDGRDEIVAFDDLDTSIDAPETYDPALNHVVTLRVTGDGLSYEELWRAPAGTLGSELALHHLDGDSELDLLVGGEEGIALARGLGGGALEDPKLLDLSPYGAEGDPLRVFGAAPGDLDGDGRPELVALLSSGGQVGDVVVIASPLEAPVLQSLATGIVQPGGYSDGFTKRVVADLDGNGYDDVLIAANGTEGEESFPVMLAFHR